MDKKNFYKWLAVIGTISSFLLIFAFVWGIFRFLLDLLVDITIMGFVSFIWKGFICVVAIVLLYFFFNWVVEFTEYIKPAKTEKGRRKQRREAEEEKQFWERIDRNYREM